MVYVSTGRSSAGCASRGTWALAAVCLLVGCAELLGIPDDPELVPASGSSVEPSIVSDAAAGVGKKPEVLPAKPVPVGAGGPDSDGVLPPDSVVGIGGTLAPDASVSAPVGVEPLPPEEPSLDAGVKPDGAVAPDADACNGLLGPVPVDVVVVFDNSGSMAAEAAAFEEALPQFAERLEVDGVDHRIILISRHRDDDRDSSQEASTSVCIGAPLGGAACPSESPVPGDRFFQYSIKIDASDSFERILQSFTQPDPFELTERGWSEWLRSGALTVFIELSDADSSVSVDAFLGALAARDPGGLLVSPAARPNFVFHSVVGLASKRIELAVYDATEPLEARTCTGNGGEPDNAGETYQALSRLTGGLRLPVCPPSLLGARLSTLAADVALRSVRVCPFGD
jgi:hypothetical protein